MVTASTECDVTTQIVIVGCGGFGREVHDVIDAINRVNDSWSVRGYVDDAPSGENLELVERRGTSYLGKLSDALLAEPLHFVIGIGSGHVRRRIDHALTSAGWSAPVLIHPDTATGFDCTFGPGSVICAGVRATTNIRTGRHTHVNLNTTIGHDSRVGDYVTINPLAAISGGVHLGDDVLVGTQAAVLQNLTVGARATVGAGSVVTKDVAEGVVVKGIPAR